MGVLEEIGGNDVISADDSTGDLTVHQHLTAEKRIFEASQFNSETLSGAKTLAVTDEPVQLLDPDGSGRNVNLPAEADSDGLKVWVKNTGNAAAALTVQDDGGGTIETLENGEVVLVVCDGTNWQSIGAQQTNPRTAGVNVETLAADKTLTTTDAKLQALDPDGNRNVDLPAEAASLGLDFFIKNTADAAETITVRDDGGSTIATLDQNEATYVACSGTAWTPVGVFSITQS